MAAPKLNRCTSGHWLPVDLGKASLIGYTFIWAITLASAAIVAAAGGTLEDGVRHVLMLSLSPRRTATPELGQAVALAAHNIPIACWPLLLGVLGAEQKPTSRHLADALLAASILVNAMPVGAALGAYGAALLPYIPQLPLEWGGLALGISGWLLQRKRALRPRETITLLTLAGLVLACAATVETFCIPHQ